MWGSIRNTGQDGFGIDDYLRQTGETSLDNRIQDEFDAVLGSDAPLRTLDALGATLEAAVHSHPTLLDDAETDSRKLLRTLKRDLTVEQLGVEFPGFKRRRWGLSHGNALRQPARVCCGGWAGNCSCRGRGLAALYDAGRCS